MKIENNLAVPEIGDNVALCGGYEAVIWDFFKVLNVTKTQVTLQPVASKTSNVTNGGMDWTSIPLWDCPSGPVIKKKFRSNAVGYDVKIGYKYGSQTNRESFESYNHH
jgi:hypothetical protein